MAAELKSPEAAKEKKTPTLIPQERATSPLGRKLDGFGAGRIGEGSD